MYRLIGKRWEPITAAVLVAAAFFLCGIGVAGQPTTTARKPNFIVILTDDLGYGDLGCFGHQVIQVPKDRPSDGGSFLPIFQGRPIQCAHPLYWQYDQGLGGPKVALRDGDWKILAPADLKTFELYNLKGDAAEANDLAAKEPERVRALASTMIRLYNEIKVEGPVWPAAPKRKPAKATPPEKD